MIRKLMPLFVLIVGFVAAALLIATGPNVEPQPASNVAPLVRVATVNPQTQRLTVETHGIVVPRTESELVPEVEGRVVEVSPSLVAGGFFAEGEVLLRIEQADYEVNLEQARAGLARAQSDLANARKNHARQLDLKQRRLTSDSQVDDAANRLRITQATLRETRARLTRAQRDLERTSLVAPYDGRVRSERVDVGQFVRRGIGIGMVYAVDYAEVRLPIPDEELAYLNLPLTGMEVADDRSIPVVLSAQFAGAQHQWQGNVVRTEGELDPNTRMVHVIARVPEPYVPDEERPPMSVGLFVDAEIQGEVVPDLVILPRAALRGENQVLVVEEGSVLRFRTVDVLRLADDNVFIGGGLKRGELVCVSPLQNTRDGMLVRVLDPVSGGEAAGG